VIASPTGTAWYVYGVVEPGGAVPEGVDVVESGGLAALVRPVPLDEFGEDVLPERLNDREWLERSVRAHEDVLVGATRTGSVVPFRFGAIYHDRDDVARLLDERAASLRASLDRVRGRHELGVKVWSAHRDDGAKAPGAPGGRAYLEQRRDERRRALELSAERQAVVEDAHERLLAHAVDGVVNRPQPRELTGRADEMLLNAAYLVPADDDALLREVERLDAEHAADGYVFEATGPWPPHNFVDVEPGEPA
jgi:hypothetical protein